MSPFNLLDRTQLNQKINARINLLEYNNISFLENGSYSVYKLEGESSLLKGYKYEIVFVSDDTIELEDIVDTQVELSLRDEINPLESKKIYGHILKADEYAHVARKKLYKITIVSPLEYLSFTKRYEVYQEKRVNEIISEIFNKYASLLNIKLELKLDTQKLPKRATTTQYAQSDLEFIQMLCEEEGLVLLFNQHENDPYTICLCELNEHAKHLSQSVEATILKHKSFSTTTMQEDYYDREKPSLEYSIKKREQSNVASNEFTTQLHQEIKHQRLRDRVEKYEESLYKDLNRYTNIDAQQGYSQGIRVYGKSESLKIEDGISVTLKDTKVHKESSVIILKVNYTGEFPNALDEYTQADASQEAQYRVSFEAIPNDVVYRPEVTVEKPKINSIQTAIVSGGDKETSKYANEIDVNERGEIRVIFHFDEKRPTSCYVPLSTIYSGDNYGAQFLPRVNSEVIVSFINGDIDRPLITGAIHNGENAHPYNLPKEKTKSFIKTQTTPQYTDKEGYNELLFEDKQGEELLSLRAQNDYKLHVLNNADTHIENDSKTVIDNDRELTVGNRLSQKVGEDRVTNILGNDITTVEKESVTTVKENAKLNYEADMTTIVGENTLDVTEKDLIEEIKAFATRYVEKDTQEKILQNLYMKIGKDLGIDVSSAYHLNAASIKETADTIEINVGDGVSLKCGANVLTVDASGLHFNTPALDTASGNGGVTADAVTIPKEKRVLKLGTSHDG